MEHVGIFGFGDPCHALLTEHLGFEKFGAHGGDWVAQSSNNPDCHLK